MWITEIWEMVTLDERDVLMAKISSGIAQCRKIQHDCEMLADGLDDDFPYSERVLMNVGTKHPLYQSPSWAAAAAVGSAISRAVIHAGEHDNTARELWSIVTS